MTLIWNMRRCEFVKEKFTEEYRAAAAQKAAEFRIKQQLPYEEKVAHAERAIKKVEGKEDD